jgi:hypothetical protein
VTGPHPHDDLVALALDDLDTDTRERTLEHLTACRSCRELYDGLAISVEEVLSVGPRVEPPTGFEARVLTGMGFDVPATPVRGPWRRPTWTMMAAASIAAVLVGVAGTYAVTRDTGGSATTSAASGSPSARPAPPGSPAAAALWTRSGDSVGTVTPTFFDGRPVYVLSIHAGKVGTNYVCRLRLEDGRQVDAADWTVRSPSATWVIEQPASEVTEVQLVTDGGKGPVWSRATL